MRSQRDPLSRPNLVQAPRRAVHPKLAWREIGIVRRVCRIQRSPLDYAVNHFPDVAEIGGTVEHI